jgi:hypothetical protein
MTTSVDTLEQRLSALVTDRRWESSERTFNGCGVPEGRSIELDMVPPGQKLELHVTDTAGEAQLYYVKTEGYDPESFHMPNGMTEAGSTYDVRKIEHTEDGLRISVGGNFMYVDSLDGLEFEIVDQDPVELANDRIKHPDTKVIGNYEFNRLNLERLQAEVDRIVELVDSLEEFPLDSSLRYSIDPSGIQAAELADGELGPAEGFGRLYEPQLYGEFHGNRFAIIGNQLTLVDDERGLAVYPAINLEERIVLGFRYLKVVDTDDASHQRRSVNDELAERLEVSLTAASS